MKKIILGALLTYTLFFSGCSTDLDVIGDYKETIIVYGLLDQAQPKQYIKINKAFLGAGDAYVYAQIKDSTQFVNSLTVELRRFKNGSQVGATITLSPDSSIPKDPGTFYAPDQANAIYSTSAPLFADSEYRLTVRNNDNGNEVTATTELITDITGFTSPAPSGTSFSLAQPCTCPNYPFNIVWNSAHNARLYQAILRLNYVDSTTTGNDTSYVDYTLPELRTLDINSVSPEAMSYAMKGRDFYAYVGSVLTNYATLVHRKSINMQLLLVAGSDELATFIDVNKPSTGIIQERPEYTNIKGGLGIFSARLNRTPLTRPLDNTSLDSLACGSYTKTLRFVNSLNQMNPDGTPVTCP